MMLTLAFSTKSMNWYFFQTHVSPVVGVAVYVPGDVAAYVLPYVPADGDVAVV